MALHLKQRKVTAQLVKTDQHQCGVITEASNRKSEGCQVGRETHLTVIYKE